MLISISKLALMGKIQKDIQTNIRPIGLGKEIQEEV